MKPIDSIAIAIAEAAIAAGILSYAVEAGIVMDQAFELTEADLEFASDELGRLDSGEIRYLQSLVRDILSDRVADLRWVEEA